jgi:hypothetical protein
MGHLSKDDCFKLRHQLWSILSRIGTPQSEFSLHAKLMLIQIEAHITAMGWMPQNEKRAA